ncbi:TPA: hypothetical protein N0F65_012569 [Lagenidium giganteum]|uniref:Protein kinase domain-containing protein n=1 Tax=Lagenidium giganteum TaxID=4803 RepID=A0AAV2YSL5_9STRA|nr:TPA: hypothetical protein N0F65_012569 [Lagenidium giganteum]
MDGVPPFDEYEHAPITAHARPFKMRVPSNFLPWDNRRGLIAIRRRDRQLAVCRCGVVLAGIYFQFETATQTQLPVALKVMDRGQVQLQRDDVDNEVRMMAQLQSGGLDAPLNNPYVVKWEYGEDTYNLYLATEFVANGSLISYAHKKIRHLLVKHLKDFTDKNGQEPTKLECVSYVYRGAGHEWMRESIHFFSCIIQGLTYMHAQNIAHMDLDVYNVAIDKNFVPRIIDFGSSQLMDHRGYAGAGDVGIKCKPTYVAPEVRQNGMMAPPRPGFDGRKADLWSVGVLLTELSMQLVQCVVWGFRGGPAYLMTCSNWRQEVFDHIDMKCEQEHCFICANLVSIPPLIGVIIKELLQLDPKRRPSAYKVAVALAENRPEALYQVSLPPSQLKQQQQQQRLLASHRHPPASIG